MTTPAVEHRIVRRDRETAGERLDRLAKLASAGLRDAELDESLDVAWISGQRPLRASDRAGIGLRPVLHTRRRLVLDRLGASG